MFTFLLGIKIMNMIKTHKSFIQVVFMSSLLVLSFSFLPHANADGGGTYSVYDTDRDGYLDSTEYDKFYESKQKRSRNLDSWAFDKVDSNGDNRISEQEMVDALIKGIKRKKQK